MEQSTIYKFEKIHVEERTLFFALDVSWHREATISA